MIQRSLARHRAIRRLLAVATVLVAAAMWPGAGAAQDLDAVAVLSADGRTADARETLVTWWDAEWDDASRSDRERALWLRGLLTLDPTGASATYQRLVTEYPVGVFTDRALFRLGSLAAAVGDTEGATRWFTILRRDFPGSEAAASAESWLAGDRGASAEAPVAAAGVAGVAGAAEETVDGRWTVQLGAFASEVTARRIADEVQDAGFDVRVVLVNGSELWRIRSGRFEDADAARPLVRRMLSAGFEATVIPGADREIGGG